MIHSAAQAIPWEGEKKQVYTINPGAWGAHYYGVYSLIKNSG